MKELIESIIKEYVDPYPGVIRKSNSPIGYGDNEEMLDKYYRVSKTEENEALNFIRSRMMDYVIGLFKIQYGQRLTSKGEQKELSTDVVNKRLKKTSEAKFPGKRKKDVIIYSAPLIQSFRLAINIFKNEDGDLTVGYVNPLMNSVKYFLVHGPEHLTPLYEADAPKPDDPNFPKPKRGFKNGIPDWTPEELYQYFYRISKEEGDKILAYIKRNIVPIAVEDYNKSVVDNNHLTAEQVSADLRKVRQEKYPMSVNSHTKYDIIVWRSDLKVSNEETLSFSFCTFKYYASRLMVGSYSPVNAYWRIYSAFTNPPFRMRNLNIRINQDDKFLTEAVEPDWHITKPEEQKALQFIRNNLLSHVIEDYNQLAAERKVPVVHHGPEEDGIIQSLRKVKHTEFSEHSTDQVLYIAEFKGWQWVFIIEKTGLSSPPHLRAGYIDDNWNESKMYDINITRPDDPNKSWQTPRSAFKKITDFMPYQPGGVPGLLSLKKKKDLSEAYGKHNLTLTKKEEDFGFHLLKQVLYDEHAKKTIRKIYHIRNNGSRYVSDKIVYEVMFSDNTVAWFALAKNVKTGKLVYYPTDKDGERTSMHDTPLEDDEDDEGLIEGREQPLNLHISKEEEKWAFQQLKNRKNSQGEPIGKYLKKIEHTVSSEPNRLSDRIKYKNTDDATTYTIVKSVVDGKLGYHAGYIAFKKDNHGRRLPDNYESRDIDDFEIPLHEAAKKRPIKIYQRTKFATPAMQRAFARVHNQQRWEGPESMFFSHANPDVEFGTGVWLNSLEHGGDLVHRASYAGTSEDFGGGGYQFGRGAVLEKAERLLRTYTSRYGFARDVAEQIAHNYHYYTTEGKFKGTLEEFQNRVKAAGERYSQEYEKIQPITIVQKLGRDVAIDTGRFQFDKAVPKLRALVRIMNSPDWERYYWAPLKGTIIKEYVTPPWPKAVLTKKDEDRAVQFLKMVIEKNIGKDVQKSLKKIRIIPSEHPSVISDNSLYQVVLPDGRTQNFKIYFSNRLGLIVVDLINFERYYVDSDGPIKNINGIIAEARKLTPYPVLTKKDEDRAVQFIKGIKDRENGNLLYNKSLQKKFVQPTANPQTISDSSYYEVNLPNSGKKQFRIFMHYRFGLIVRDVDDAVVYKLDEPNPYTAPFMPENIEDRDEEGESQEIEPKFLISKKEEAEAVQVLSNLEHEGFRFGTNMKKIYDQIRDHRHVIKYLVDVPSASGVYIITKNDAGWIIIKSNWGSVIKVIKH